MGFYDRHVLPRVIDLACGVNAIAYQRRLVVPEARGRVLEIGLGSGLNLPFYDAAKVEMLWGLEPAAPMRRLAAARVAAAAFPVEWLDLPGETIPLDDASADTVVTTYTLCSIPDAVAAVREMRRVLKPGGQLLFSEHGRAPDVSVRRWQDRLTPMWKVCGGGCHLNRDIPALLRAGGFEPGRLASGYIPGPRPMSFHYWGAATR